MIFDSAGNAINSFDDEVAARAALRAIAEREPTAADDVLLISYDDDGNPVGEAVTAEDLPPSSMSLRGWVSPGWISVSAGIGAASRFSGKPVSTVYRSGNASTQIAVAA
jgi:hypothetical protein